LEEAVPMGREAFAAHLNSHTFLVAPGQILSIPVLIYNKSSEDQDLTLSVRGVPSNWIAVPSQPRFRPPKHRQRSRRRCRRNQPQNHHQNNPPSRHRNSRRKRHPAMEKLVDPGYLVCPPHSA
jgi:hypothetical protein